MSKSVSIAFTSFSGFLLIALIVISIIWHNPISIALTILFGLLFIYSAVAIKRNWAKLE